MIESYDGFAVLMCFFCVVGGEVDFECIAELAKEVGVGIEIDMEVFLKTKIWCNGLGVYMTLLSDKGAKTNSNGSELWIIGVVGLSELLI